MELRELAERVLFATTLEEKLDCPGTITDERPGPALAAPGLPGRPARLQFKGAESTGGEFRAARLEQEAERGRLLHFFANHELLATELMALVLLRFPEAPAAFRRGVLQTLRDEQEHTRRYIERMRACGVEFGELPVSGYFWRAISGMESPIDYVAGLSLTFEQANLDFARHFSRGFARVGDVETAQLLETIYRDEIAHVAYGLKWFRRWKNPDENDWEAFCRQLKFPLSPRRAKGAVLNVEGRRAAGLDAGFIEALDLCAQSKGRTPVVHWFNPFAEACLARGRSFTPNAHQAGLARDLAHLPMFLGREDDVVLVPSRPAPGFLRELKAAGVPLPEWIEIGTNPTAALETLGRRKLGGLRPWAWGPDSLELFEPLLGSVTGEHRTRDQRFSERLSPLYAKSWSADFLRRLLRAVDGAPWLCPEETVGLAVTSLPEALEVVRAIRARGHHRVVAKESLGLAGGNALRLWEPAILEPQRRWMEGALAGGGLVIEPWLDRVFDWSLQLEMTASGLRTCGSTVLIADESGRYLGNVVAPQHGRRLPSAVGSLLADPPDVAVRVQALVRVLVTMLEQELRALDFLGPVGVDAFVYRDPAGRCRLKPVVEINPRHTMGRLAVELMKRACPGSHGRLRLLNRRAVAAAGPDGAAGFAGYAAAERARRPLRLEGEPVPRIREGLLCLNDPETAQVCLAVFEVSREPFPEERTAAGAATASVKTAPGTFAL